MRFVSILAVMAALASPTLAEKHALILSNAEYDALSDLRNTHADADAYADVFRGFGYDVTRLKDQTHDMTLDALDVFLAELAPGDEVVLVYSGHGWSDGQTNYLIPTDAPLQGSDRQLKRDTLALQNGNDGLLDELRAANVALSVAIIDACRNNPFLPPEGRKSVALSKGLARITPQTGSFVIYAAGAGQEALDRLPGEGADQTLSVFTRSFLPHLKAGLYLEEAISRAQVDTAKLARQAGGHVQHPAYYDAALGLTCVAGQCVDGAALAQKQTNAAAAERDKLAEQVAALQAAQAKAEAKAKTEQAANAALQKALGETDLATRIDLLSELGKTFPGTVAAALAADAQDLARASLRLQKDSQTNAPIVPLVEQMAQNVDVLRCDTLAGDPNHPDKAAGLMRAQGISIYDLDAEPAILACMIALEQFPDHPRLLAHLGRALDVTDDLHLAANAYRTAADLGDPVAANNLGEMYMGGYGVPQSDEDAVAWIRLAAEQGFVDAQSNLGAMYSTGRGVAQSDTKAVMWYRKAAEQGHAKSQYNLATSHQNGRGVEQSYTKAAKWYRKSAEQGFSRAQNNLAYLYLNGRGVPQSDTNAFAWFRKSAEQGFAGSQANLGWHYRTGRGVAQSDTDAVIWYRKAAIQGSAYAQNNLGAMYEKGHGVGQSDGDAVTWYRKAAEQGHAKAQANLAWMYEHGKGVPKSKTDALAWYRKAAKQGNDEAQNALVRLVRDQ